MSVFGFIDRIEKDPTDDRLAAFFTLKGNEEFLKDHFEGFPVMPGVLLLESLKQAACALISTSTGEKNPLYRLTEVSDIRFGQFVKPGSELNIRVRRTDKAGRRFRFDGRIDSLQPDGSVKKVLTAHFTLSPVGAALA